MVLEGQWSTSKPLKPICQNVSYQCTCRWHLCALITLKHSFFQGCYFKNKNFKQISYHLLGCRQISLPPLKTRGIRVLAYLDEGFCWAFTKEQAGYHLWQVHPFLLMLSIILHSAAEWPTIDLGAYCMCSDIIFWLTLHSSQQSILGGLLGAPNQLT